VGTFYLKRGDTRPVLEVQLKNPDGSVHDLTGSTAWRLHVYVAQTVVFTREMTKQGADTLGTLRYAWQPADWAELPTPAPADRIGLAMEFEVEGGSGHRLTFPNGGFDTLQILGDVDQVVPS
jgi:hypothetical protein